MLAVFTDAGTPRGRVIFGRIGIVIMTVSTVLLVGGVFLKLLPVQDVDIDIPGVISYSVSQLTINAGANFLLFTGKVLYYALVYPSRCESRVEGQNISKSCRNSRNTSTDAVLESKLHSKKIEEDAFDLHAEILEVIGGEENSSSIANSVAFSSRSASGDSLAKMDKVEQDGAHGDGEGHDDDEGHEDDENDDDKNNNDDEKTLAGMLASVEFEGRARQDSSSGPRRTLSKEQSEMLRKRISSVGGKQLSQGRSDSGSSSKRGSRALEASASGERGNSGSFASSAKVQPV